MEGSTWHSSFSRGTTTSSLTDDFNLHFHNGGEDDESPSEKKLDPFDAFAAWPTTSHDSDEKQLQKRHEQQRASVKEKRRSIIDGLSSFRIPGDSSFASEDDFSAFSSDSNKDKDKDKDNNKRNSKETETLHSFLGPQEPNKEESVDTIPFANNKQNNKKTKSKKSEHANANAKSSTKSSKKTSTSTQQASASDLSMLLSKSAHTPHTPKQTTTARTNRRASLGKTVRFQISATKIVPAGHESVASEASPKPPTTKEKPKLNTQQGEESHPFDHLMFLPNDVAGTSASNSPANTKAKKQSTTLATNNGNTVNNATTATAKKSSTNAKSSHKHKKKEALESSSDHKVNTKQQKSSRTKKQKLLRKNSSLSDINFDHRMEDDASDDEGDNDDDHPRGRDLSQSSRQRLKAKQKTSTTSLEAFDEEQQQQQQPAITNAIDTSTLQLHMDHPGGHTTTAAVKEPSNKETKGTKSSKDGNSLDQKIKRQNSKEANGKKSARHLSSMTTRGDPNAAVNDSTDANAATVDNSKNSKKKEGTSRAERRLVRRNSSSLSDIEGTAKRRGRRKADEKKRMHQSLRELGSDDDDKLVLEGDDDEGGGGKRQQKQQQQQQHGEDVGTGEIEQSFSLLDVDIDIGGGTDHSNVDDSTKKSKAGKAKSRRGEDGKGTATAIAETGTSNRKSKQPNGVAFNNVSEPRNGRTAPDKKSQEGKRKSKAHNRLKMHMSLSNLGSARHNNNSNDDEEEDPSGRMIGGSLRVSSTRRMSQSTHEAGESQLLNGAPLDRSAKSEHIGGSHKDQRSRRGSHYDRFKTYQNLQQEQTIEKSGSSEQSTSHRGIGRTSSNAQGDLDEAGERSSLKQSMSDKSDTRRGRGARNTGHQSEKIPEQTATNRDGIGRSNSRRMQETSSRSHASSKRDMGRSGGSHQRHNKRKSSMSHTDTTAATSSSGQQQIITDRPIAPTVTETKTAPATAGDEEKKRNRGRSSSQRGRKSSSNGRSGSRRREEGAESGQANSSAVELTKGHSSKELDNSKPRSRSKSQRKQRSSEIKSKSGRGRSRSRHRKSEGNADPLQGAAASSTRHGSKSRRSSQHKRSSSKTADGKRASSKTRNGTKTSVSQNKAAKPDDEMEPSMRSLDLVGPMRASGQGPDDRLYKSMGFLDGNKEDRKSSRRSKSREPAEERPLFVRTDSDISSLGFSQARKRKSKTKSLDSTDAKASSQLSLDDEDAPIPTAIIVVGGDEPKKQDGERGDSSKSTRKERWKVEKSTDSSHSPMMTFHSSFGSLEEVPAREKHRPEERLNKSLGAMNYVISPQYERIKESLKSTDIPAKARSRKIAGAPLTDDKAKEEPTSRGDMPRWMKRASTHSLLSDFGTGPSEHERRRKAAAMKGTKSIQDNSRKLLLDLTEQKMIQEPREKFWSVLSEAFQPVDIDSASYSGISVQDHGV